MVMTDGLAVYNLDDRKTGDVTITVGEHVASLSPGRHVLVTKNLAGAYENVNPAQLFAYRNVQKSELHDMHIYAADFHLIQALKVLQPIKDLLHSSGHSAEVQRITNHLLKTAAVMSQCTGNGVRYKQYLRPRAGILAMRN
jgi:hypothetical protein